MAELVMVDRPHGHPVPAELRQTDPNRPNVVKVVYLHSRTGAWIARKRIVGPCPDPACELCAPAHASTPNGVASTAITRYGADNCLTSGGPVGIDPVRETVEPALLPDAPDRAYEPPPRPAPPPATPPVQLAILLPDQDALDLDPAPGVPMPITDPTVSRAVAKARAKQAAGVAGALDALSLRLRALADLARHPDLDVTDTLSVLEDVCAAHAELDELRTTGTTLARAYDATWADIANALGMTRGNAHNWYTRRTGEADS